MLMVIQIFNWSLPFGKAINTCLVKNVGPKGSSAVMVDIKFGVEAGTLCISLFFYDLVV